MLDYKDIGMRIRTTREKVGMTQEQLAEATGVGTSHISHIETGNSFPSIETMVNIINALNCSADELLCLEVEKARPVYESWIKEIFDDCTTKELKLITSIVLSLKDTIRRTRLEDD